jgi:LmbE family N-acetylglucosaminyl deacetylase
MVIRTEDIERLGSVLSIWAHPDDEAYLAAGLMAAAVGNAQRVACVTMTAGELGTSEAHPDPDVLGPLRRQELRNALAKVGVHEHVILGLPDGGCADLGEDAPVDRLRQLIDGFGADTIVTFGPDGMTGHPDHIAVSRWVDLAVARTRRPVRVLHPVLTPAHVTEFADVSQRLGLDDSTVRVREVEQLDVHLTLGPEHLARKLAALRAHVTQTTPVFAALGMQRVAEWVREETFVLSPARAA